MNFLQFQLKMKLVSRRMDLVFIERSYVGDVFSKSPLYMVCLLSVHINRDQLYFETAGKDSSFSI